MIRRAGAVLSLTATAVLALSPSALADGAHGGPNQVVYAVTTAGNTVQERSGVQVGITESRTIGSVNYARADAHDCTGCRSIAVAFQAVIVVGSPRSVQPINVAYATNENCTSCVSDAYAYQYVAVVPHEVEFSDHTQHQIAQIRQQVAGLTRSGLSPADLNAQLANLQSQFAAVVAQALQSHGDAGHASARTEAQRA